MGSFLISWADGESAPWPAILTATTTSVRGRPIAHWSPTPAATPSRGAMGAGMVADGVHPLATLTAANEKAARLRGGFPYIFHTTDLGTSLTCRKSSINLVGGTGFEPVTPTMSR